MRRTSSAHPLHPPLFLTHGVSSGRRSTVTALNGMETYRQEAWRTDPFFQMQHFAETLGWGWFSKTVVSVSLLVSKSSSGPCHELHTHTHTHTQPHKHTHTQPHKHTHTRTKPHARTRTKNTRGHTHNTHAHAHTHTQSPPHTEVTHVYVVGGSEVPGVTGPDNDQDQTTTTLFGHSLVLKFQDQAMTT